MNEILKQARRIVVKVGSSLVTNEGKGVDAEAIGNWCRQMAALAQDGAVEHQQGIGASHGEYLVTVGM